MTHQVKYENDKDGDEENGDNKTPSVTSYLQLIKPLRKTVDLLVAHLAEPCCYFTWAESQVRSLWATSLFSRTIWILLRSPERMEED